MINKIICVSLTVASVGTLATLGDLLLNQPQTRTLEIDSELEQCIRTVQKINHQRAILGGDPLKLTCDHIGQ